MRIAITRQVSPNIGRCELTYLARRPIDVRAAQAQHGQYEECLAALGCQVYSLPAEPDLPDSVFVEDAAVVLDELAVITRPGAASRRPETPSIAEALRPYRRLVHIKSPGILDGGDMLRIDKALFVGLSHRSNPAAVEQMRALLSPLGYTVAGVQLNDCLHLKSAVTLVAKDTLLVNPAWVDVGLFGPVRIIDVDPAEPLAANALLVGDTLVFPAAYPATRRRLEVHGRAVRVVDASELAKAEGGVTCCSLIFEM